MGYLNVLSDIKTLIFNNTNYGFKTSYYDKNLYALVLISFKVGV